MAVRGSFRRTTDQASDGAGGGWAIANLKGMAVLEAEARLLKNAIDFYN